MRIKRTLFVWRMASIIAAREKTSPVVFAVGASADMRFLKW